jgi:ABC-2 type transport system permease protein
MNELTKIFRRVRTWVLASILLIFVIGGFFFIAFIQNQINDENVGWRDVVKNQMVANQMELQKEQTNPSYRKTLENDIAIAQYQLEENIPPIETTIWGGVNQGVIYFGIIIILTIIIAADIVAGEFSSGTIKLLLLQPASRSKILMAKYISVFIFILFMLALLLLAAFVCSGIIHGFHQFHVPYLEVENGKIVETNGLLKVLETYGLQSIEIVFVITIAFLISTVFRSSAMAISMAIGIYVLGPTLVGFLSNYEIGKYYLFTHVNLSQYMYNEPVIAGTTMTFAISVLVVYFVVMNIISWTVFHYRDVT